MAMGRSEAVGSLCMMEGGREGGRGKEGRRDGRGGRGKEGEKEGERVGRDDGPLLLMMLIDMHVHS